MADISKEELTEAISHWALRYFEAESSLKKATDKEEKKELREAKNYAYKLLMQGLAEYDRKYSLGPFAVPQ